MARVRFKAPSPIFSAADLRRELARSQRKDLDAKIKRLRKGAYGSEAPF